MDPFCGVALSGPAADFDLRHALSYGSRVWRLCGSGARAGAVGHTGRADRACLAPRQSAVALVGGDSSACNFALIGASADDGGAGFAVRVSSLALGRLQG